MERRRAATTGSTVSLIEAVLSPVLLQEAWKRIRANRGLPGKDGVSVRRFECERARNLNALADDVRNGDYHPGPLLRVRVQTADKTRWLAIPTLRDRVLQRAVLDVVSPLCEPQFAPGSFGYRPGRGVAQAVAAVEALHRRGKVWVLDADIADCFDHFDHRLLRRFVREFVPDCQVCALLDQWIDMSPIGRGVSLGTVVSPLLCNIYLHQVDMELLQQGFHVVRYADDFVVLCANPPEVARALIATDRSVRSLALQLSRRKTRIVHFDAGFTFLGVHFQGSRQTSLGANAKPRPGELAPDALRSTASR